MLKLTVKTDNAAFDGDSLLPELATILHDTANRIEDGQMTGNCRDTNGNTVGEWSIRIPRNRNK